MRTARPPLLLALVLVLLAAGCTAGREAGRGPGATSPPAREGLTALGRQLPAPIRSARQVRVGADISYAPLEFYDALAPDILERLSGEPEPPVQGVDADLAAALGRKLGVRFRFVSVRFDDLISELNAGRIDAIISGMTITPERARQVSFISYFRAGTSILVPRGNPDGIRELGDLCGKTVTVQSGTTQEQLALAQRARCPSGLLTVRSLASGSQVMLDVKWERADAALLDFPVAAYNAKVSGKGRDFEVVGEQIEPGAFGIGVRKQDGQLREALRAALEQAIQDRSYHQVLAKWNVTDGAVEAPEVIGAP